MAKTTETKTEKPFVFPMHKIFYEMKSKHKEALLLFRCGDFYEAYCEDAKKCADVLGITMTWRSGVEHNHETYYGAMAGFPYHALETYLPKLIREGIRVAICDQLEDPKLTKKLVKRGITELVTPKTEETMKLNLAKNVNETKNVQTAQVNNPQPSIEYVEVEEIKDEKPAPKAKKGEKSETKPRVFNVVPYTTQRGKTAFKLFGFADQQSAEEITANCCKKVSVRWATAEDGSRRYYLSLCSRYGKVAEQLCNALNSNDAAAIGDACKATFAVYESAAAEREAEKSAKEAASSQPSTQPDDNSTPLKGERGGGCYTAEDVAKMFQAFASGSPLPAEVAKYLNAA